MGNEEKLREILKTNKKERNLTPYDELAYRIVETAVQDYVTWRKSKKKRTNEVVDGIGAKRFLESKVANFYSGIPMEINIREWVDRQLATHENIELSIRYERRGY